MEENFIYFEKAPLKDVLLINNAFMLYRPTLNWVEEAERRVFPGGVDEFLILICF